MSVTLTTATHVAIDDDHDLVLAFLNWQSMAMIFPLRNAGGSSGLGSLRATFDARHAEAIAAFFDTYQPKDPT